MRFETLIFLIIAFNVVAAVVKRRAKSKAQQSQPEQQSQPPRPDASRTRSPERADDAFEEPMRMPGLGRDILDQIARDLGLKVPKPAPAEPVARESRREEYRAESRPEMRAPAPARSIPTDRNAENRQSETPYVTPGIAKDPARGKVRAEVAVRKTPGTTLVPRVNLRDPVRLREAIMLKEVLGEPVSRRVRSGGALRRDV